MSKISSILIIGNKSVGKSTLFKSLLRKKTFQIKEEKKTPPLLFTPLINYTEEILEINDCEYRLIDTPSFIFNSSQNDIIKTEISNLIYNLIEKSDLILLVINPKKDVNEDFIRIRKLLIKKGKKIILLINKFEDNYDEYFDIQGIKDYFELSLFFNNDKIIEKIKEKIFLTLPSRKIISDEKDISEGKLKLLIFGPPNSGKSTLMNFLLKENRSIATKVSGTTQEPVISNYKWKNFNFQLIDTAGIDREIKSKKILWKNCDLAWAVVDATLPITKQILQIVNLSEKNNKPLIILINKCDLINKSEKELEEEIRTRLKSLSFCPIIYISASKGINVNFLMKTTEKMIDESKKFLGKKNLERTIEEMVAKNPPNFWNNGKLKIYYAKQEPGLIQTFIFFINDNKWIHFSYERYISNYLRKKLDLKFLPIKLIFKKSL